MSTIDSIITLETPGLNKAQKEILTALGLAGIDVTQSTIQEELTALSTGVVSRNKRKAEVHAVKVREAEGVLLSLNYTMAIEQHKCNYCKRTFGTNYRYNKHCSEECLKASLDAMGLAWDPEKSAEERWKGEPPLTIAPETLAKLKVWAKAILDEPWDDHKVVMPAAEVKYMTGTVTVSKEVYELETQRVEDVFEW